MLVASSTGQQVLTSSPPLLLPLLCDDICRAKASRVQQERCLSLHALTISRMYHKPTAVCVAGKQRAMCAMPCCLLPRKVRRQPSHRLYCHYSTSILQEVAGSGPNVGITKTASSPSVSVGRPFNFTLTVTSDGTAPAQSVVVRDEVPASMAIVGLLPAQGA